MPSGQNYALYLQATRQLSGGAITRRQWVILPPLNEVGPFLQFHREQPRLERRIQWSHQFVPAGLMKRDLPERIAALNVPNPNWEHQWKVSPLITVQVTESELKELHGAPRTPYQVLKRVEKVARKVHGFTV